MEYNEYIRLTAGVIQLAVGFFSLRLNRLFRTPRVGWALFAAFLTMALLLFTQAIGDDNPIAKTGLSYDVLYLFVSVLLLIGLAHTETCVKIQLKQEKTLQQLSGELELRVAEKTQALVSANEALRHEITARAGEEEKRRSLEEQFRQSQKMEAIGNLAGGIAHDFNNLLTVIGGYVQILRADERDTYKADTLDQVSAASNRAANLTRQLLTFSRRSPVQTAPTNINDVIENVSKMLMRVIGEDVVLQKSYGAHLPPILADTGMMEQIIMNLAVNARDAMPGGGTMTITTTLATITDTHRFRKHEARAGQFVCLTVRDTGSGMTPETFTHLFEPFFTTKETGKGTGLGLATVYGIVKQHSGWVEVDTNVNVGTEFRIYFPCTTRKVTPVANGAPRPIVQVNGKETILVVEDEPALLALTSLVLRNAGYNVIEADCAAKALEIWEQKSDNIDLVLTDIVMPGGTNGRDLAVRMCKTKPDLKVIFVSGYSPAPVDHGVTLPNKSKFIPKPYDNATLLEALRECLDNETVHNGYASSHEPVICSSAE